MEAEKEKEEIPEKKEYRRNIGNLREDNYDYIENELQNSDTKINP